MIEEQKSYETLQNCFDDICLRIIAQGEPSKIKLNCRYRILAKDNVLSNKDLACAIGIVLSDFSVKILGLEKLNPPIHSYYNYNSPYLIQDYLYGAEAQAAIKIAAILLPNIADELRINFLHDIQKIHDDNARLTTGSAFVDRFKYAASQTAQKYNLTIPF